MRISSWDRGYGDFVMAPDLSTLRRLSWQPGTALLLADVQWLDGAPVVESPRQILQKQLDRLAERGWTAFVGTELEFILFDDSYAEAWNRRYQGLTPANQYNVDYSILGTSRVEPLLRAIRLGMRDAGLQVESAKGECNFGQHEIAFKYTDALATCDNHVLYKTGAKEIAAQHGSALTFMAKYNEREGNSCHIHLSLRTDTGEPVFAGDRPGGRFARVRKLRSRTAGRAAGVQLLLRPQHQLLQALPARLLRADRGGSGVSTTGPAPCGRSDTARRCGSRTGCPAETSTPTWPWPP